MLSVLIASLPTLAQKKEAAICDYLAIVAYYDSVNAVSR